MPRDDNPYLPINNYCTNELHWYQWTTFSSGELRGALGKTGKHEFYQYSSGNKIVRPQLVRIL